MMKTSLLAPTKLNDLELKNAIAMAPMTRARATSDGVPTESMATYYAQRASAGLIIAEAINICEDAIGSPLTPGLYTKSQLDGWRQVTRAVHDAGGRIYAQLWHTGRVAHSLVRNGRQPVAPSPVAIKGQQHFTGQGMADYEIPRELTREEIIATIDDYRQAAINAIEAGFDGVELHSAFGYLPNQFLVEASNMRTDEYGGTIKNRCKYVLDVMHALIEAVGKARVGIKLSPNIPFNGMIDSDPLTLYSHLLGELNKLEPGYVHLMQALFPLDDLPSWPKDTLATFGPMVKSPIITNGGYNFETASDIVESGNADLVSFGTLFVANPDLPERFARGAALESPDQETMYGGADEGYIDYPPLDKSTSNR